MERLQLILEGLHEKHLFCNWKQQRKSLILYAGHRTFQKRTDFQSATRVSRRQTLDEIPKLYPEFYLDM
jgi:hypothetical protein